LLTANNNVICANNNNNNDVKSHVTPVKVFPPSSPLHQQRQQQASGDADAVTSSDRCHAAAGAPGLLDVKTFGHAQPVYYNQSQCVPLYGQYPRQYDITQSCRSLVDDSKWSK